MGTPYTTTKFQICSPEGWQETIRVPTQRGKTAKSLIREGGGVNTSPSLTWKDHEKYVNREE